MPTPLTIQKSKITFLTTVYPPISNQEAAWLQRDPEVEALLRTSDFYMICGRTEAKYKNLQIDQETNVIRFNFVIGEDFSDDVSIDIYKLPAVAKRGISSCQIEAGEKFIKVVDETSDVLDWFTTEKLILDRSRGKSGLVGFDRYREAAVYDLLYVGIAKVGDSFDRLLKHGHKARMEILSNEPQRLPGARVSDETYLFMFKVEPLIFQTFEPGHNFKEEDFSGAYEHKRIVADAEKAFVSLLKPDYNVVKFGNYPLGADGLYGSEYLRYGYAICENFSFNTPHGQIRGGRDPFTGLITNDADAIFVQGDVVKLLVSGVHFSSAS